MRIKNNTTEGLIVEQGNFSVKLWPGNSAEVDGCKTKIYYRGSFLVCHDNFRVIDFNYSDLALITSESGEVTILEKWVLCVVTRLKNNTSAPIFLTQLGNGVASKNLVQPKETIKVNGILKETHIKTENGYAVCRKNFTVIESAGDIKISVSGEEVTVSE